MDIYTKYASVKVQGKESPARIPITSSEKPLIKKQLQIKWQNIIDVMANCLAVPAGLIMQLDEGEISVFISSKTPGNPYPAGGSEKLMLGLYCETVVGSNDRLLVPDAREDILWHDNPDIKLGMVSYLGFPIKWPDGEFFGTICVLDSGKNYYSEKYIDLMEILKSTIEEDLDNLFSNYQELLEAYTNLKNTLAEKDILLSEVHHRVKNNMQIISSLVELQCSDSQDPEQNSRLGTIKNRILAMGIVHEILYTSNNFKNIRITEYIKKMLENLNISLVQNNINIAYEIIADDNLLINFETVIPVGLIINEIITNSIKHAFPGRKTGNIKIEIKKLTDDTYMLKISDNGCGIQNNTSENRSMGLGNRLINLLVEQLDGTVALSTEKGTEYSIVIKKIKKEEKRWRRRS